MARTAVQVRLQSVTGLSEDVVVNTWAVNATTGDAGDAPIITAFQNFYNAISSYYSPWISRTDDVHNIRLYNIADPIPRAPYFDTAFDMADDPATTNALPNEVALCLSLKALPVSGVPIGRRRGRVYLGPWSQTAAATGGPNPPRPAVALLEDIIDAFIALATELGTNLTPLAIWSRADDAYYQVATGHVDNEWDTVRSRGAKATFRVES